MFYLNSSISFGIPPVLVFQLEVYYKVDRLLTRLTAQTKGTTARWYSNKTSLSQKALPSLNTYLLCPSMTKLRVDTRYSINDYAQV